MFKFIKSLFPKTPRGDEIEERVNYVYFQLISEVSVAFTELERVQILNEVRRRLDENFKNKRSEFMSKISDYTQKIKELDDAENYLK
jgi:hypothetical protein